MRTFRIFSHRLVLLFLILTIVPGALTGCGQGSDASDSSLTDSSDQSGDLVVSLTDAPGDFANYTVTVAALTLTRANGSEVSALPRSADIDFAQYTDMTEFLTAATVPSGVYTAATLTLDYTQADLWVEDDTGELVRVPNSNIVDEDGAALTQVEVTVELEDPKPLIIAPGIPAHLQLDFNLAATNSVSFDSQGTPTVSVDPYLVADVNQVDVKFHRLRGLLDEVDPQESAFTVYIRPFYVALADGSDDFGRMTVTTDSETIFDLNDQSYQGDAGLTAMQTFDPLCAIVVVGSLSFDPLRFQAEQVYAGTSVPWGGFDVATGTVTARTSATLTVKGATLVRSDGSIVFHDLVTVTLGDETKVTRQLTPALLTTDDISVGQRVTVFGALSNTDPIALVLDAAAGHVRLHITTVRGSVQAVDTASQTAPLHLALQSINHHGLDSFDFNGTGIDPADDADPGDYEISTGSLNLGDLALGDPMMVRGFVQPFGEAPQDFNALTLINVANTRAILKVRWEPASNAAVETLSVQGMTLNLNEDEVDLGTAHHVLRAFLATNLTTLDQAPTVVPREDGRGRYILRIGKAARIFRDFESFSSALENHLADGGLIRKIRARGYFDDATATFTADIVDLHLE